MSVNTPHPTGDPRIIVLYDGACRLCRRSTRILRILDWYGRLVPVDFRDPEMRERYAPDLALQDLDRSLHIKLTNQKTSKPARPNGKAGQANQQTFRGFDAFRALSWHLPILWPIAPLLSFPGVPTIGRRIYAHIAKNRNRCADGHCAHEHHADR